MLVERAVDTIALGILIVLMASAPSDLIKGMSLVAAVLLLAICAIAWRRRKR